MFEGEYDVVGLMGAVVDNDCQTVFLQQAGEELWIDLGADLDDFSAAGDAAGGEIVVGDHGWTSAGDAAGGPCAGVLGVAVLARSMIGSG